jgi:hypothetical protein
VKTWTAYTAEGRPPALIPEGFSWGAFFFGWLWLAYRRAWIFAAIALAADLALSAFTPLWTQLIFAIAMGVFGQDLRRWALELRGYTEAHVIASSSLDGAFGRLLAVRPDLIEDAAK